MPSEPVDVTVLINAEVYIAHSEWLFTVGMVSSLVMTNDNKHLLTHKCTYPRLGLSSYDIHVQTCIHDTVENSSQCGIRSSILVSCLRSVSRFDASRHQLRTRRVSDVSPCSMRLRSSRSSLTMLMRCWMPSCCCLRCCNTQTQWR